mmetsp:Transcript_10399/g.32009  ORF Transcript_10399/g.32009 Transcript_10399/m.32009 type:complete len:406 (-) Transcript_10399:11-1228(-)
MHTGYSHVDAVLAVLRLPSSFSSSSSLSSTSRSSTSSCSPPRSSLRPPTKERPSSEQLRADRECSERWVGGLRDSVHIAFVCSPPLRRYAALRFARHLSACELESDPVHPSLLALLFSTLFPVCLPLYVGVNSARGAATVVTSLSSQLHTSLQYVALFLVHCTVPLARLISQLESTLPHLDSPHRWFYLTALLRYVLSQHASSTHPTSDTLSSLSLIHSLSSLTLSCARLEHSHSASASASAQQAFGPAPSVIVRSRSRSCCSLSSASSTTADRFSEQKQKQADLWRPPPRIRAEEALSSSDEDGLAQEQVAHGHEAEKEHGVEQDDEDEREDENNEDAEQDRQVGRWTDGSSQWRREDSDQEYELEEWEGKRSKAHRRRLANGVRRLFSGGAAAGNKRRLASLT